MLMSFLSRFGSVFIRANLWLVLFAAIVILGSSAASSSSVKAQGSLNITKVKTVPTSCNSIANPVIFKIPASTADLTSGIYICNPLTNTYAFQTNTFGASLTAKTMLYASATPVTITSTAAPTDGQLLIGDTSDIPALGTLTGTANETLIINAAHSITIGLAATVIHKAGSNFQFTDTTDTTKKFIFDASGITTATTRTIILPDSNTTLPIAAQILTFSGPTVPRTYTFPDANTTLQGIATAQTVTNKTFIFGGGSTNLFADSADNTKTAVLGLTNITTGTQRTVNVPDAASTTVQTLTAVDSKLVTSISGTTGILGTATADVLLNSTAAVNMNTATPTVLYTSPSGRSTVIKSVTIRNCSTSMTTASYSFGWTSATFLDVIANATHTELTGATLYTSLPAKAGSLVGTSTSTFNVLMNTLQGGAATCTMDVWGYTF